MHLFIYFHQSHTHTHTHTYTHTHIYIPIYSYILIHQGRELNLIKCCLLHLDTCNQQALFYSKHRFVALFNNCVSFSPENKIS
jgi:hypothetical protein